jgi:hypothetical protein
MQLDARRTEADVHGFDAKRPHVIIVLDTLLLDAAPSHSIANDVVEQMIGRQPLNLVDRLRKPPPSATSMCSKPLFKPVHTFGVVRKRAHPASDLSRSLAYLCDSWQ